MFDIMHPGLVEFADADDGAVAAAVAGWARIEAAAAARRLAAVAELVRRRTDVSQDDAHWACDEWDSAAAEVAAALGVNHGKASGQMYLALTLRERLPQVAQLFVEGRLSAQLVSIISWHTTLINDPDALRCVDSEIAAEARRYGKLSANKTAQAIDAIVDRHDPAALRRARITARGRELVIDRTSNPETGTTALWGRLFSADAEVLGRRLMAMAHEVCEDDPRTIAQRCADALGALGAGADRLVCACGNAQCPAAECGDQSSAAIIHVIAEQVSLDAPTDPGIHGEDRDRDAEPDPPGDKSPPALILGGPLIPAPLLAQLINTGAKIRPLIIPGPHTAPEPGYRPSTALDEFIRCRDMTCRFPGCDKPAEYCDLDHAIAFGDGGLTHPSNLRCLCRKHHLLKTFWTWRDRQYPDGRIDWTSPSGQTYTTHPGSRLLFPALCQPAGGLPSPASPPEKSDGRTLMMPTRRRTRAQNRTRCINAERALNADYAAERIAERNQPPPF